MKDALGDRMKLYEQAECGRRAMPLLPICIRLDGKGFSRWTNGLQRPFDPGLSQLMIETTQRLVEATGAIIGYTQSDEISLVLYSDTVKSELWFNGNLQKLVSVSASIATAAFNDRSRLLLALSKRPATFDARAWTVPTMTEAANVLLWRELDATKNSVSMAARHYYSHAELMNKKRSEMMDLLMAKGINWNDYPTFFKRGTYVRRVATERAFSAAELAHLPPKHEARTNPKMLVRRHDVLPIEIPPLSRIEDRVTILFGFDVGQRGSA